ncbi:MAG: hypothetical protein HFH80_06120 [Lachnospiraceae bacterium]|nr:hypothetical protein [Lachnospiraceae bacterium]
MIKRKKVEINNDIFCNMHAIISFVLHSIIDNTINLGTLLVVVTLTLIHWVYCHTISLYIPLFFACIYFAAALEESYHIAMIVLLGKQNSISYIEITKIKIGAVTFIGGASVCYKGMFKKSDIFYISLAGPIMPLFYIFVFIILFVLISFFTNINALFIIKILIGAAIAPMCALIPLNTEKYCSDGYKIKTFIKTNKISWKQTISAVTYTIKSMLSATIDMGKNTI